MSEKISKAAQERASAKKALQNGSLQERDTYTAKQVATRCGTDPKTMRKFFRSNHSTIEPVGQGGRYEFDAKDMPTIMREFSAWRKKASSRPVPAPKAIDPAQVAEVLSQHDDPDITLGQLADAIERAQDDTEAMAGKYGPQPEDYLEPTPEELMALEDLELDLDDLDED